MLLLRDCFENCHCLEFCIFDCFWKCHFYFFEKCLVSATISVFGPILNDFCLRCLPTLAPQLRRDVRNALQWCHSAMSLVVDGVKVLGNDWRRLGETPRTLILAAVCREVEKGEDWPAWSELAREPLGGIVLSSKRFNYAKATNGQMVWWQAQTRPDGDWSHCSSTKRICSSSSTTRLSKEGIATPWRCWLPKNSLPLSTLPAASWMTLSWSWLSNFAEIRRVSNRPLTPILLKSIAIHLPFLSRYFCKSMPSRWQTVAYAPPICITIRLPFVSRYFCRSIRVRGRLNTPSRSGHNMCDNATVIGTHSQTKHTARHRIYGNLMCALALHEVKFKTLAVS